MKKFLLALMTLLPFAAPVQSETKNLSSDVRQIIENRVKDYCKLMALFSGNIENITLLDSIVSMCENNKVQTFDDLSPKENSSDIEYNSYPLFQYLQNITSKYENSLDVRYSGFTCEKVISEPKMNSMGLDDDIISGSSILSNSYALVNVTKHIKGNGINQTVRLRVTVNISNMKIGGTVSQNYEDPYSLYLEGTSLIDDGKTEKGLELLERSSSYKTYAGRYRAMTVMGITYYLDKNYKECERLLREASEHDPVAGIFLADIYLGASSVVKEYFRPYVALQLLEKYARFEDKDYPYAAAYANYYLCSLYTEGNIIPENLEKAQFCVQTLSDYLDKNFDCTLSLLCFLSKSIIAEKKGDSSEMYVNLKTLDNVLETAGFVSEEIEKKLKSVVYYGLAGIYHKKNDKTKVIEYIDKLKGVGSPESYCLLAMIYRENNMNSEALKYYRMAADAGNGLAAYIMSRYYMPQKIANSVQLSADADSFDKFLYEPRTERTFNKAKHYARISAEGNNLDGLGDLLFYCVNGAEFGGERDLYEGLKWTCVYANRAGYDKAAAVAQYANYFAYQIAQNKDERIFQSVQQLADNNDPACNYILNLLYSNYTPRDTVKAAEYLLKSADAGFYVAMNDLASSYSSGSGLKKNPESAIYWFKKMADMNYPAGWSGLAYCEGEFNHNYDKEKEYYLRAFEMRYPDAAMSLAECYLDGEHGFEKDPAKALYYLEKTQVFCNELGWSIESYPDYEKYVARAKQEMNENLHHNTQISDQRNSEEKYISELDILSDQNISLELRISEAERLLSVLFESSSSVVKTVGSNGTTVIATETAIDFMMRLSTSSSKIRIVQVSSRVNSKGKFIELMVRELK